MKWLAGVLAAALVVGWVVLRGDASEAVRRAEILEDSLAVLGPVVDSLVAEAERRDTVLVAVTDTVRLVVERTRTVQVEVLDTLRARLDSAEIVLLDSLVSAHAEEVAALERLAEERLLWGTSWKGAAEGLEAENVLLDARGSAWEAAYSARSRQGWYERAGVVVVVLGAVLLR